MQEIKRSFSKAPIRSGFFGSPRAMYTSACGAVSISGNKSCYVGVCQICHVIFYCCSCNMGLFIPFVFIFTAHDEELMIWLLSRLSRPSTDSFYDLFSTPNFGLNLYTALVIPHQGFWNAVIYTAVSFSDVEKIVRSVRQELQRS
jgi:hypothetical protein